MRSKIPVVAAMTALVLALVACQATAQNYDTVLKSLTRLDSMLQTIKQSHGWTTPQPNTQVADIDGTVPQATLDNDQLAQLTTSMQDVVVNLKGVMEEAKKADADRPKNPPSIGHGKIQFTGMLHQQFYQRGGDSKQSTFDIKVARLAAVGNPNKYVKFRLEGEFARTAALLEASGSVMPNQHWYLQLGQFKPPFCTDFLRPGAENAFVSGSKARALASGYDVGAVVGYENKWDKNVYTKVMSGMFNGAKANTGDANIYKNFVGRAEFKFADVFMLAPNLIAGKTNDTGTAVQDLTTWGGSATWTFKGSMAEAEFIHSTVGSVDKTAWHVWGGQSFKTNLVFLSELQLVARYEQFDPNLDAAGNRTYRTTVGTNLFIDKKYSKVQFNYQINGEEGPEVNDNEFLLNFQVVF